ncbi:hypothetical protein GU926_14240 [Nibribacter ruber]|uniref:Uncharacterized protein n=1 Tax=Nibribacter ruber TaxID=2698458 RepID=A0A6P1P2B3_9BACT|nr:hypothetical protein [Nibribacter ruber]QHL88530.1 hypothetical protein GU926_14240 [Nibribacter ruber]
MLSSFMEAAYYRRSPGLAAEQQNSGKSLPPPETAYRSQRYAIWLGFQLKFVMDGFDTKVHPLIQDCF